MIAFRASYACRSPTIRQSRIAPTQEERDIARIKDEIQRESPSLRTEIGGRMAERVASWKAKVQQWPKRRPTVDQIAKVFDGLVISDPARIGENAGNDVLLALPGKRSKSPFLSEFVTKGEGYKEQALKAKAAYAVRVAGDQPVSEFLAQLETAANSAPVKDKTWREAKEVIKYAQAHADELQAAADAAKKDTDAVRATEMMNGIESQYRVDYAQGRGEEVHDDDAFWSASSRGIGGSFTKSKRFDNMFQAIFARDKSWKPTTGYNPLSLRLDEITASRVRQGMRMVGERQAYEALKAIIDPHTGLPVARKMERKYNNPKVEWNKLVDEGDKLYKEMDLLSQTEARQEAAPQRLTNIQNRLAEINRQKAALEAEHGDLKNAKEWEPVVPDLDHVAMQVYPGYSIAVRKSYAPLVESLTGYGALSGTLPGRILTKTAAGLKHGLLAFDSFHAGRMLQNLAALSAGNGRLFGGSVGYNKGASILEYSREGLAKAVEHGLVPESILAYADEPLTFGGKTQSRQKWAQEMVKSGLNAARIQDAIYKDVVRNIPGIGQFNRWVFDKVTRGSMIETSLMEMERLSKAYPELSLPALKAQVATDINTFFGSLGRQGLLKNPTLREIAYVSFLAPQWVESLVRRDLTTAYRVGRAPISMIRGKGPEFYSIGRGMGAGIVASLIGTQIINLFSRGKTTFQNEEDGHGLDAWVPDVWGGSAGYFMSPIATFGEPTHQLLRYYQQRGTAAAAGQQFVEAKMSPIARAFTVLIGGRDPMTGLKVPTTAGRIATAGTQLMPIPIGASTPVKEVLHEIAPTLVPAAPYGATQRQIMSSAGFKMEPVPTHEVQVRELVKDWMATSADPKIREKLLRQQEYEFGRSAYSDLRRSLRSDDMATARAEYNRLLKTHKASDIEKAMLPSKPFTGSQASENQFLKSLSTEDKAKYRAAIKERRDSYQKFLKMRNMTRTQQ